jgi:hypothetical protein
MRDGQHRGALVILSLSYFPGAGFNVVYFLTPYIPSPMFTFLHSSVLIINKDLLYNVKKETSLTLNRPNAFCIGFASIW